MRQTVAAAFAMGTAAVLPTLKDGRTNYAAGYRVDKRRPLLRMPSPGTLVIRERRGERTLILVTGDGLFGIYATPKGKPVAGKRTKYFNWYRYPLYVARKSR
jgi:hypothetical protein